MNIVNENLQILCGIYGEPGCGKTTLSLSSPNPIIFDCENGTRRISFEHMRETISISTGQDIKSLESNPPRLKSLIKNFDTVVIDTLGSLINVIISEVCGFCQPTLKDWGTIKYKIMNFWNIIKSTGKHIIVVAHSSWDNNEPSNITFEAAGSVKFDLRMQFDLIGYMSVNANGKRIINFTPTERLWCKNSIGLTEPYVLPNVTTEVNDFLERVVFAKQLDFLKEKEQKSKQYLNLTHIINDKIKTIVSIKQLNDTMNDLKKTESRGLGNIEAYWKRKLFTHSKNIPNAYFDKEKQEFCENKINKHERLETDTEEKKCVNHD